MANAIVTDVAKMVRKIDRIWADDSLVVRIAKRAGALDVIEASRHAAYPLVWLVDTGRLSAETERALMDMPAREFAATAVKIAATMGSVRSCADAWKDAVGAA